MTTTTAPKTPVAPEVAAKMVAAKTTPAAAPTYRLAPATASDAQRSAILASPSLIARAAAGVNPPSAAQRAAGVSAMAKRAATAQAAARAKLAPSWVPKRGGGWPGIASTEALPSADALGPWRTVHWPGVMDPGYVPQTVGIAMSGGGTTGDFEVGALRFLNDHVLNGMHPDIVTGTSVGAVNGGMLAEGSATCLTDLETMWFETMQCNASMYVPVLDTNALEQFGIFVAGLGGAALVSLLSNPLMAVTFASFAAVGAADLYDALVSVKSLFTIQPIRTLAQAREALWSPTGPGVRGAGVAVVLDGSGHRIVVARARDDTLYVKCQTDAAAPTPATAWSAWTSIGGPVASDPLVFVDTGGKVVVAAVQGDGGAIAFRSAPGATVTSGTVWSPWGGAAPPAAWSSPAYWASQVTTVLGNQVDLFAVDSAGEPITTAYADATSSQWSVFGGTVPGAPSSRVAGSIAVARLGADGSLVAFARCTDGSLVWSRAPGVVPPPNVPGGPPRGYDAQTFGAWQQFADDQSGATSNPCAVRDSTGSVQVFWRDAGGAVVGRTLAAGDTWGTAVPLGGLVTSNLTAAMDPQQRVTVFARGLDDAIWWLRAATAGSAVSGSAWQSMGAPAGRRFLADPFVLATSGGLEVYAVADDHAVWCNAASGDGWTEWVSLGGYVWTGVEMRVCTVSLETAEARTVDQAGRWTGSNGPLVATNAASPDIRDARTQGIIASASIPSFFEAVPLDGMTWVDGGVRRGIPIRAAIDAGAAQVFALGAGAASPGTGQRLLPPTAAAAVSQLTNQAPQTLEPVPSDQNDINDYSQAGAIDIAARTILTLFPLSIVESELAPETPWEVPVWVIQPTFDVHDSMTIETGLVRINYDYGWLRASDVTDSPFPPDAAMSSTDDIISARFDAWVAEVQFFTQYTWADAAVSSQQQQQAAAALPGLLDTVRQKKTQVYQAIAARYAAGLDLPSNAPEWFRAWEGHSQATATPPQSSWIPPPVSPSSTPWDDLTLRPAQGAAISLPMASAPSWPPA